jgi:hypothetical protein
MFFMTLSNNYLCLKGRRKVVQAQLRQMECGEGVSFWPKPILHSTITVEYEKWGFIVINPYEFCNKGYDCYDVAIFFISTPIILSMWLTFEKITINV